MKIDINLEGAPASAPEYDALHAALLAAQRATPTARLSRELREVLPPREALEQLLDGIRASQDAASSLAHRFACAPDPQGETA